MLDEANRDLDAGVAGPRPARPTPTAEGHEPRVPTPGLDIGLWAAVGGQACCVVVPADRRTVTELRLLLDAVGPEGLRLDDLRLDDLEAIDWAEPLHLAYVAEALKRVAGGEVDYLAVRAPAGLPVAMGGIDFAVRPGAGTLWQLLTHPELRGLGLGSRLVAAAETRMRRRGCRYAVLGVEDDNHRARALYERLGYVPFGREVDSWLQTGSTGAPELYETEVTLLRKMLGPGPSLGHHWGVPR